MSIPTSLGKYEIVRKIAAGGMAEVYLAKQIGPGGFAKFVVIKNIHSHLCGDDEFTTMFINEARLAAMLNHQNIVQTYDFGATSGTYYLAMEYIRGHDLRAIYRACQAHGNKIPFQLAIYITQQICKGLHYAHRLAGDSGEPLGLVHRDISPQNVLISYEGEVKITDFGIAVIDNRGDEDQTGSFKGKISYMSPEQASGKPIDHRSDIFSVGIVLYELVVGQRLFQGDSDLETLRRIRSVDVPELTEVDPTLPPRMEQIIRRALAADPRLRYQTALELYEDLEQFCADHQVLNQAAFLASFVRDLFPEERPEETSGSGGQSRFRTIPLVTPVRPALYDGAGVFRERATESVNGYQEAAPGERAEVTRDVAGRGYRLVVTAAVAALLGAVGLWYHVSQAPPLPGPGGANEVPGGAASGELTRPTSPLASMEKSIMVFSEPSGAEVFADGDFQGLTPCRVQVGSRTSVEIVVSAPGHVPYRDRLVVESETGEPRRVVLQKVR
ncbi:MAG: serine/threonine protein kinase [Candidatus Schekmanbacteria bacterium]|nr:serine/threonine protein kinase [Candidatus Schekmanbacteria bacterium]